MPGLRNISIGSSVMSSAITAVATVIVASFLVVSATMTGAKFSATSSSSSETEFEHGIGDFARRPVFAVMMVAQLALVAAKTLLYALEGTLEGDLRIVGLAFGMEVGTGIKMYLAISIEPRAGLFHKHLA